MATQVIDRAIEVFGAAGVSDDTPLAYFYAWARALRIVDGPMRSTGVSIAREELRRSPRYVGRWAGDVRVARPETPHRSVRRPLGERWADRGSRRWYNGKPGSALHLAVCLAWTTTTQLRRPGLR